MIAARSTEIANTVTMPATVSMLMRSSRAVEFENLVESLGDGLLTNVSRADVRISHSCWDTGWLVP